MSYNFGNDAVDVAKCIKIGETQHTQPHIFQESVTFIVLRLASFRVVLAAIDFDDQLRRRAIEINDIVAHELLTIELKPIQLLSAEFRRPQEVESSASIVSDISR